MDKRKPEKFKSKRRLLVSGRIRPDIRRDHLQRSNESPGVSIKDGKGTELQQTCGRDGTDERICTED